MPSREVKEDPRGGKRPAAEVGPCAKGSRDQDDEGEPRRAGQKGKATHSEAQALRRAVACCVPLLQRGTKLPRLCLSAFALLTRVASRPVAPAAR